ncbi:MAG: hypothetical protein ACRDK9_00705 [Solirubrobacterales bacterium]
MLGAATFINPLLKVVTTVAILAAVYYFAIRRCIDDAATVAQMQACIR